MKLSLTREEMLVRRRLAGGFEPLRTDCTVEETAGVDIDALLEQQLRARYLELLDTATEEFLAPADVASGTLVEPYSDGGSLLIPPSGCRRVLRVRMEGWEKAADVRPAADSPAVAARQRNPYTAATASMPVALALPGGKVAVWPGGAVRTVCAVSDAGPEVYNVDERAVAVLCKSEFNPVL